MKGRSLRRAIDTKCSDCIFDPLVRGNWRQQVTLCTCTNCSLWDYRPVSSRPLPKPVLEFFHVPVFVYIVVRHREALPARALIEPATEGQQNGNASIQDTLKASQSVKVGMSEPRSRMRTLWAAVRGEAAP